MKTYPAFRRKIVPSVITGGSFTFKCGEQREAEIQAGHCLPPALGYMMPRAVCGAHWLLSAQEISRQGASGGGLSPPSH